LRKLEGNRKTDQSTTDDQNVAAVRAMHDLVYDAVLLQPLSATGPRIGAPPTAHTVVLVIRHNDIQVVFDADRSVGIRICYDVRLGWQ
jgi:hypothetical protein